MSSPSTSQHHPSDLPPDEPAPHPSGGLEVAPLDRRVLAHLVDTFVGMLAFLVIALVVGFAALLIAGAVSGDGQMVVGGSVDEDSSASELVGVAVIGLLLWTVPIVYLAWWPGRDGHKNGFTIGKRVAGVRIVAADGSPLTRRAARRRALAFLGPVALAAFAGPLLDAAFGTSPLMTMVMLLAALTYVVADLTFAPARSGRLASIHDRVAETVVVSWPSGLDRDHDGPKSVSERPGSGMAAVLPIGGAALVLLFLIGLAVGLTSDEGSTEPEAPRPVAAARSGAAELNPAARPAAEAVKNAKSPAGAQAEAGRFAKDAATCLGKLDDLALCQAGYVDGKQVELTGVEGPAPGLTSIGRTGAFFSNGRTVLSVLAYDRQGLGWGYRIRAGGLIEPMCTSIAGLECASSPAAARFLSGDQSYARIRRAYTAARDAPQGNVTPDTP